MQPDNQRPEVFVPAIRYFFKQITDISTISFSVLCNGKTPLLHAELNFCSYFNTIRNVVAASMAIGKHTSTGAGTFEFNKEGEVRIEKGSARLRRNDGSDEFVQTTVQVQKGDKLYYTDACTFRYPL